MDTPPRRRLRWLQYVLFALLALSVLVVPAGLWFFGWFGVQNQQVQNGQVQNPDLQHLRDAIWMIQEMGGTVVFDHEVDDQVPPSPIGKPSGPVSQRRLRGDESFDKVAQVNFDVRHIQGGVISGVTIMPSIRNADVAMFDRFPRLRHLKLRWCNQMTDAALVHVGKLKQLRSLVLQQDSRITNAGLVHLAELQDLESLNLSGNDAITDAGIRHLEALTRLKSLDLRWTKVTGAGVERLQKALPDCRTTWQEEPSIAEGKVPR